MELDSKTLQEELNALLEQYSSKELSFYQELVDEEKGLANEYSMNYGVITKEDDTNG